MRPTIHVELTLLSEAEGGRSSPPGFQALHYRPHIVVAGGGSDSPPPANDLLGVAFSSGPDNPAPGDAFNAEAVLIYWPDVDYSRAVPGAEFAVHEGARIVGRGRIIGRRDPEQ